jgi:hypothetical protein
VDHSNLLDWANDNNMRVMQGLAYPDFSSPSRVFDNKAAERKNW